MDYNQLTIDALKHYQNHLISEDHFYMMEEIQTIDKIINHLK